ncbi:MAG TPA: lysophospholipid acyltransferase family protein [Candidatus Acidoferrum sp.]|jgi:1-acyl-sn-glycerol-3-phosphate acyltransferase|nr:lysophospholipid acyltransferase family protein [Candidatus Acidoferrum sp.]
MRKAWLTIRSAVLWAIAGIHFFLVGLVIVLAGLTLDRRKHDWINRGFFRNIMRLTAVKFEVRRSPGFDPTRTSIFICNHVNIFDPFVIYSAIPQFVRGFELESHFKLPIYGWIMGWFGNVAVPDAPTRESLEVMTQRAKAALDADISLIAFAEGSRTRDGLVHEFKKGMFNLAQKFGVPIVPMSIVGSYQFFQTGNWMLYPGKITVMLHDTIETANIPRGKIDELRQQVQEIVSAPVEESLKVNPVKH